jgi:hypothetical protein
MFVTIRREANRMAKGGKNTGHGKAGLRGACRGRGAVLKERLGHDLPDLISTSQGNLQKRRGAGSFRFCDPFRRALGDDLAAAIAGFGAEVEDPVRLGGDGHVMLDDHHGVAFIDEAMEDVDEAIDVFEVEADGGFLDQIEIACLGFEI